MCIQMLPLLRLQLLFHNGCWRMRIFLQEIRLSFSKKEVSPVRAETLQSGFN
jgi:hypothetical protein